MILPPSHSRRFPRGAASLAPVLFLALWAGSLAAQPPGTGIHQHQQQRDQAQQELVIKLKQSQEFNRPNVSPEEQRALEATHGDELLDQREQASDQQRRQQQLEQAVRVQPEPEQQRQLDLQRLEFEREQAAPPGPRRDPAYAK